MSLDLEAVALSALEAEQRADPLAHFECKVWAQRVMYEALSRPNPPEVYWHAASNGGKTTGGAALDLAFMTGRDVLGGVRIPVLDPPVAGALIMPSYKLSSASSLGALRALIGDWPHHEGVINSGQDAVGVLYVKHRRSRSADWSEGGDWSRLYIMPHEGVIPRAMRLDFVHGDEVPPQMVWEAARNRAKAGRDLFLYVTATPDDENLWYWIVTDFPEAHNQIENGRLRLQSTIWDNKALSPGQVEQIVQRNRTSPHRLALLYGDHVSVAGTCPYDGEILVSMRDSCVPGVPHAALEVGRNGDTYMGLRPHERGEVRVFSEPAAVDRVLVIANPSAGIKPAEGEKKGSHLANLTAVSVVQRRQILRWVGYETPAAMALLARAVCNRYRDWVFVPEMNGGWGEELLRSFLASPAAPGSQGMVYQEVDPTSTSGNARTRVGWWQNEIRRTAAITALQRAILEKSLGIPSRDAIDNLLRVTRNHLGRYDDPERGLHPRDFLVLGMACSILEGGAELMPAAYQPEPETDRERFEQRFKIKLPGSREYTGYNDAADPIRWR